MTKWKTVNKLEKRKWLNPTGHAFVCIDAEVEEFTNDAGKVKRSVWGGFTIGDCHRTVTLDIEKTKQSLNKFKGLAEYANAVVDYIEEELNK